MANYSLQQNSRTVTNMSNLHNRYGRREEGALAHPTMKKNTQKKIKKYNFYY